MEFLEFSKISRLSREIWITEKIDGTNACIAIEELEGTAVGFPLAIRDGLALWAGSRTRWIYPDTDNYGFAKWALENIDELLAKLGPGRHFGEWWGQGIQRNYGLEERRFSLFNADRWGDDAVRPACCSVVPVLYRGDFYTSDVLAALDFLEKNGSMAAPGFMKPEGVVVYHTAARISFKKTIEKDEEPKSLGRVR